MEEASAIRLEAMTNSRDRRKDRMRSNEAKHEAKRERGDVTRDDDSSPRNIFVGAGRKDTDKNRVATRGNSNNFIIIERKHRVIYAVPFNDLRPRATFTATRLPRKISLSLSLCLGKLVRADGDKPRHLGRERNCIVEDRNYAGQIGIDSS